MQLKDMEPVVKKFYTGLEEGIYWARQCPECGAVEFPPHLACNACGYHKTDWVQVSGHGHLIDFTLPGPQNDKPYLKGMASTPTALSISTRALSTPTSSTALPRRRPPRSAPSSWPVRPLAFMPRSSTARATRSSRSSLTTRLPFSLTICFLS